MNKASLREYDHIRDEMTAVKSCMTNYIGYLIGGSGAAVFGMAALASLAATGTETAAASLPGPSMYAGMAYPALILSLFVSMVLLVITYKFYSHNRYAGYCKLLSQEMIQPAAAPPDVDLFTWEICLERLRAAEASPELLLEWTTNWSLNEPEAQKLDWVIRRCVDPRGLSVDLGACAPENLARGIGCISA